MKEQTKHRQSSILSPSACWAGHPSDMPVHCSHYSVGKSIYRKIHDTLPCGTDSAPGGLAPPVLHISFRSDVFQWLWWGSGGWHPCSLGQTDCAPEGLQKSERVPSMQMHKITVDISVIKGSHSHKYSVWSCDKVRLELSLQNCMWVQKPSPSLLLCELLLMAHSRAASPSPHSISQSLLLFSHSCPTLAD